MAGAGARSSMLALLMVAGLVQTAFAATYNVGGETAVWGVPQKVSFYDDWAVKQTFYVGDKLVFTYSVGHNVYEVSSTDATACEGNNPLRKYETANPTVPLTSAGPHAFICEIKGHCILGMKMTVDVAAVPKNDTSPPSPTSALTPAGTPNAPSAASDLRSRGAAVVGWVMVAAVYLGM